MAKTYYQTKSWMFGYCPCWGWRIICRIFLIYIYCNDDFAGSEGWIIEKYFVLSGILYREKDSVDIQKWKQNLVALSTTQRDVKKRVSSSESYSLRTPGRGMKTLPLNLECVISWLSWGPWECWFLLVWSGEGNKFSQQHLVGTAMMAWPRESVRQLFLGWSGLTQP